MLLEQLHPIAHALVAQAFAPDAGRRDRLILVSSAGAGEGKSFSAVNLALALTQDDRRRFCWSMAIRGRRDRRALLSCCPSPA